MTLREKWNTLQNMLPQKTPIGITFQTTNNYYYYDTPTGKILHCKEVEYKIIQFLLSGKSECSSQITYSDKEIETALDNIIAAVSTHDILRLSNFESMHLTQDYEDMLQNHLHQVTLELTERCNLRCGYCIYHEGCEKNRNFGTRDMTPEIAFQSIKYAKSHSVKESELHIGFYGGEPLLCFPLLISCIEYAKKIMPDKILYFSFTTNGVLITQEMVDKLNEIENLNITVSLDGPKEFHDTYRIDQNGNGSFDKTLHGLKLLCNAFGFDKTKKHVLFSMVYAPPYSTDKLHKIQAFFESLCWLPKECVKYITYPDSESFSTIKTFAQKKDDSSILSSILKNDSSLTEYADNTWEQYTFTSRIFYDKYLKIFQRAILSEAYATIPMNGCCIPGQRKIYIAVDGTLKLCEKVGNIPSIGTLKSGINYEFAKKIYLDDYQAKSLPYCKNCWLARLCNVCYSNCYTAEGLDIEKKAIVCKNSKKSALQVLISYFSRLEKNPYIFDSFSEAVLK